MVPSDYFSSDYFNDYFGDGGVTPPPVPIQSGAGGNPTIIIAPMAQTWQNGGTAVNNLALYPRRIFWDAPAAPGDALQIEDGHGTVLFRATARAQYDSQYAIISGGPKWAGGTRWRDFIVTEMDSGSLFIWFT